MRPYSMDLRERVVAACDAREGMREQIAKRFGVSTSWIRRVLQRRRETGSIAPLPQNAGRKPKLSDRQMAWLKRLVAKRPDATLQELKKGLRVTLWGAFPAQIEEIDRNRENRRFLPGHLFPDNLICTPDPAESVNGTELIVSAVPCQYMRGVWNQIAITCPPTAPVVSVAKGIEVHRC